MGLFVGYVFIAQHFYFRRYIFLWGWGTELFKWSPSEKKIKRVNLYRSMRRTENEKMARGRVFVFFTLLKMLIGFGRFSKQNRQQIKPQNFSAVFFGETGEKANKFKSSVCMWWYHR